jgi:2-polyprenyl-3-methyl-5-hydroxy-6-metoxy-1,4-benzoquinol methylase
MYQEHYLKALNPVSGDLKANLLRELRSFFSLTLSDEEIYRVCKEAPEAILREWKSRRIDPKDRAAVTAFYVDTNLYCYELLALEIDAPVYRQQQLVEFVNLLKRHGKLQGVDYGSGIGTLGIYLNRNGVRCDFADVSRTNLSFISQRLRDRGISGPRMIHLLSEALPSDQYDFITAFDVIEHVTDPVAMIREMTGKLKYGGLFIFNLLYDNDDDTPHLLQDPNLVRKNIRGFGMRKIGTLGEFKIYQKVKRPDFVNWIIFQADSVFWDIREKLRSLKT